jgi:hypothetical protein
MPHAYTEDQFVEQPAIGLSTELGWIGGAQMVAYSYLPQTVGGLQRKPGRNLEKFKKAHIMIVT